MNQPAYCPPRDPLTILHEDATVVAIDKPAGLLSVPGRGPDLADCLMTRLQRVFPDALLVHRLDRDTSGVMIFALTAHAQRHLGAQFEARSARKSYVALIAGHPSAASGTVDLPLIVDWPNRPRQKVCAETGKPAVTDWRVLRHIGAHTRVRLHPRTGRTHQLRVHMQALGHPILGDSLYADAAGAAAADRLMLHAEELRLKHPESGVALKLRARAPF
ncbi:MAG: RluA family pseudouridine synthase [Rhodobacteraceae bacterium]|nr:RluA family pseudouridine synthase [Paracoccaceae bacterium]